MAGENSLDDAEGEHCARLRREAPQIDFKFRLTECPKTISCDVVQNLRLLPSQNAKAPQLES